MGNGTEVTSNDLVAPSGGSFELQQCPAYTLSHRLLELHGPGGKEYLQLSMPEIHIQLQLSETGQDKRNR